MRLAEIQTTNIRAGVLDEAKFTLDATGPVFQTIISGLYTNKKQAPLREYGANAFDASKNFDLHLPSVVDPRVVIRDYGPGLSHEDVMHKFTKLGHSTKRDSNDAVGSLGYGCKSAFAYTNQFNVRSFQRGEVRTYVASLEKDGIPRMVHLATRPTTDRDGLEVSFNVKSTDIVEFRKEAKRVYFAYEPRPNVTNETWAWPELELVAEGAGWKIYYQDKDQTLTGPYARMGCVLYPINMDTLGWRYDNNWVKDDVLILDVPIGSVDIQHSRESLGYNDATIKYLQERLKQVHGELAAHFLAEVDKIDHIIKAALFFSKHRYRLMGRVCGRNQLWKGQQIPSSLPVQGFRLSRIHKWGRRRRYRNRQEVKSFKFESDCDLSFGLFEKDISIFIDQGESKPDKRILHAGFSIWNGNDTAIWVKTSDPKTTLEYLGNPDNVHYLAGLPEPPKPPRAPRSTSRPGATIEVLDEDGRHPEHFDTEISHGWFIDVDGRTPNLDGRIYFNNDSPAKALIAHMAQVGIYMPRVYAISASKQKRRIFRKLKRLSIAELVKMIGPVDFAKALHHESLRKASSCELTSEHPDVKLPADLEAIRQKINDPGDDRDYDKYQFLKWLGEEIPETQFTPAPDINEMINERFPLAAHLTHNAPTPAVQQYIDLMEKHR
jgi:hypothetical protein